MASTVNVGTLRALLTADTAKWTSGLREAGNDLGKLEAKTKRYSDNITKLMSQAGKAATDSSKLVMGMGQAGQQAAKAQQAALQAQAQKAKAWGQMLQQSATASAKAQQTAAQASQGWAGKLSQLTNQANITAKASSVLSSTWAQMAAGFGAVSLLSSAVGFIGQIGREAVKTAGDLVDMSGRTGMSIEGLQRMGYVAKQTGSTLEGFQKAAFQLGIRVEGANKELRDQIEANNGLRISYQQLRAMKPDEQFEAVLEALSKIEDPQRRNELAVKLFGKTAAEVLPAVAEGYRKIAREATVASDAQVRAVDAASDAWQAFMDRTGTRFIQMLGRMVLAAQQFLDLDWNSRLGAIADMFRTGNFTNTWSKLADEGARKAELLAAKASLAAQKQRELAKSMEFGSDSSKTYAQQLAEVQKKIAGLTPAQRAEILAADKLGAKLEDLAGKYNGLSEEGLKIFIASTKKGASAMSEADRNATHLADELQNLRQKFSGADAIENVEKLRRAFGGTIPIAKMTAEAQREVYKILDEGATAWRAQGIVVPAAVAQMLAATEKLRIIPDIMEDIRKSTFEVGKTMREAFRKEQAEQAEKTADRMLASFRSIQEAGRKTATEREEIDLRRAEHQIDLAKQQGATWQQVYAMEHQLGQRRLQQAIREARQEADARIVQIDTTTDVGRADAAAWEDEYRAHVQRMEEDFTLGEIQKRRELQRTHSFALQVWDRMRRGLDEIIDSATRSFSKLLFNVGFDPDGSLKKAAQEAREAYDEIRGAGTDKAVEVAQANQKLLEAQKALEDAKARKAPVEELQRLSRIVAESRIAYQQITKEGKGSAKEIQEAFDKMREAEEAANNGWAKRFKAVWADVKQSIFSVFDDILQMFVKRFLAGMLRALAGARGGFAGAFSGIGGDLIGGLMGKGAGAAGGAAAGSVAAGAGAAGTLAGGNILGTTPAVAGAASGGAGASGGAAGAAGGIGTAATIGITGGIAGAALLAWGIWKKGLFRGGEESLKVNSPRDKFLGQFGPSGTGPDSGFGRLAAILSGWSGQPGGGPLFQHLITADKAKDFKAAQADIVAEFSKHKQSVQSFSMGGFVPPGVVQPAILHGGSHGEFVIPGGQMATQPAGLTINNHFDGVIDSANFGQFMDAHMPQWMHMATLLNKGGISSAINRTVSTGSPMPRSRR